MKSKKNNCYYAWNQVYGFTWLFTKNTLITGLHYDIEKCDLRYYKVLEAGKGINSKIFIDSGTFNETIGISVIDNFPENSNDSSSGNLTQDINIPIYQFVSALESIIQYNMQSPHIYDERRYQPSSLILDSALRILDEGSPKTPFTIISKVLQHSLYTTKKKKKLYAFKNESESIQYNLVHWLDYKTIGKEHEIQNIKNGDIIIVDEVELNTSIKEKPYFQFPRNSILKDPKIYHNFSPKWKQFFTTGFYHNGKKHVNVNYLWGDPDNEFRNTCVYHNLVTKKFESLKDTINFSKTTGRATKFVLNCTKIINSQVLYAKYKKRCSSCNDITDELSCCDSNPSLSQLWFEAAVQLKWRNGKNEEEADERCTITGPTMKDMLQYCIDMKSQHPNFNWSEFKSFERFYLDILSGEKKSIEPDQISYTKIAIQNCLDIIKLDKTRQLCFAVEQDAIFINKLKKAPKKRKKVDNESEHLESLPRPPPSKRRKGIDGRVCNET